MPHKLKTAAIITAAGQGRRMEQATGGSNKVFMTLRGRPILEYAVLAAAASKNIGRIIVTAALGQESLVENLLSGLRLALPWTVVTGGVERQHSIANALKVIPENTGVILVHDGARPLAGTGLIDKVIEAALRHGAALPAVRVKDTIKESSPDGFTAKTLDRDILRSVQTPQAFKADILLKAYEEARLAGYLGTDDASLVERMGVKVKIITGDYQNIKITTPEDIILAESFFKEAQEICPLYPNIGYARVGIGYDVHKLVTGRKLILGGVEIDYSYGLEGHSDADVLLHAIKDALLGAAALGDIGVHFPDSDSRYKGISSVELLKKVRGILSESGFKVANVDATIVAQRPKLSPYIAGMNQNIATALGTNLSSVNVKATTTEGLGFAGRGEGISAYAIASIITGQSKEHKKLSDIRIEDINGQGLNTLN